MRLKPQVYGLAGSLLVPTVVLLVAGIPAHAQDTAVVPQHQFETTDPIELTRMQDSAAAIRVDGHLDEPAWSVLPVHNDMRVLRPDTLQTVPFATDVRLFYTEKGLYASFDMEQPADTIIRRLTVRDMLGVNRDYVSITLDTSGTGRYGYWMNLALGGNQIDGKILPERQYNREWDGAWYGATQITNAGWSAEFFVPWSQMAMPKAEHHRRIGIYTSRRVAHLNETWGWPSLPRSRPHFMSRLQPLELQEVDPRPQWSFFPYVSSTYDRVDDHNRYKAGFDVFWRLSSNLQLTATANPDFGSVEADDVIVNLTADETFFPEKRLFFQEGQEIFNTTSRSNPDSPQPLIIVNTRRVGGRPRPPQLPPGTNLTARDRIRPSELLGAVEAAGQLGSFRYGLLGAWENETDFAIDGQTVTQDGRNFGAVRVLYEDDNDAAYRGLGFISTLVAHPQADAVVHGIDFHYLTSSGRWNVDGQLLYSNLDNSEYGRGGITNVTFTPAQGINHTLALTVFDEHLDVNDFGFQIRNDIQEAWYALEWLESDLSLIRDFRIAPSARYAENADGYRTNVQLASEFDFTFHNLDRLKILAAHYPRQFDDRNSFGNGTFAVDARNSLKFEYLTNTAKPLSLLASVGYKGEFIGGYTLEAEIGLTWKPLHFMSMETAVAYLDRKGWLLHQEQRNFTAFDASQWQPELILEFFPTARQQFRLALQWAGVRAAEQEFYALDADGTNLHAGPKPSGPSDDFSLSRLNFQLRYRWQIAPLSDLFVVYTKGDARRADLSSFRTLFGDSWNNPLHDQLVIKLRYRFGF